MSALIRYCFPAIEPYELSPDDFARIWREAQYVIHTLRLITKE